MACYRASVPYDFSKLEVTAASLQEEGRYHDALRVYLFMADGDQSLDGGYLEERIGECYEQLGELDAARYWYGRAVEKNPGANANVEAARRRLGEVSIIDLCGPET